MKKTSSPEGSSVTAVGVGVSGGTCVGLRVDNGVEIDVGVGGRGVVGDVVANGNGVNVGV